MGCSGSKASKAAQKKPAQIPEGDFKVILESTGGQESLGVVAKFPEKLYILVDEIKEEGLIPSWNKGKENEPEMQVKVGDSIVAINGVFGDSDLMMAEVKALTEKQPDTAAPAEPTPAPAEKAPAAEVTPAPEAPATAAPAAEAPAAEAPATAAPAAEAPAAETPAAEGPAPEAPAAEAPQAVAEAPAKAKSIILTVKRGQPAPAAPVAAAPEPAKEAPAAEVAAAEAPATAAPAAEAPAAEAPAAEAPAVEAPQVVADEPAAEPPSAQSAAAEEPSQKAPVDDGFVSVEPADAEMVEDEKEQRYCKLAMC